MSFEESHFDELDDVLRHHEERVEKAYRLGLLHGMNAQSMARVKESVMEFEDYGWSVQEQE
jgi:hypothetical protein